MPEPEMLNEPEILAGGVNEVVRIGDRVRRPTGFWSPRVHDLLRHLADRGFTAAPRVHEVTADGFEMLDFLPGEVSNYPLTPAATSTGALLSAAARPGCASWWRSCTPRRRRAARRSRATSPTATTACT